MSEPTSDLPPGPPAPPVGTQGCEREPWLFPADALPVFQPVLDAVRSHPHTGRSITRDERVAGYIISQLLEGTPVEFLARKLRISEQTIRAARAHLEDTGKMEGYKQRVSQRMGAAIELGVERIHEKLVAGAVPANVLPIIVGVLADKKALLDGEPTAIVGHVERPELDLDRLNGYLASLPRARAADCQSVDDAEKPNEK